jgi:hypothetical protein
MVKEGVGAFGGLSWINVSGERSVSGRPSLEAEESYRGVGSVACDGGRVGGGEGRGRGRGGG